MPTTLNADEVERVLGGLSIIDCDAHFTEPPDLWTSRASQSMKAAVPVQRTVDGLTAWYLGDHVFAGIGANTIGRGRRKVLGTVTLQPWEEIDPSAWDVNARLALLDEMGIYAQVLYPNAIGFASNSMFGIQDLRLRDAVQSTYNDFLVDVQHESRNRLFPQGVLPIWDMDSTVKEMSRLRDQGMRGFTITDKPHLVGLPDLDASYFDPMWSLANDMGIVMNFHIGSGGVRQMESEDYAVGERLRRGAVGPNPELYWDSFGPQRRLAILATQFYMSNVRIILNLCMSNLFDRYPNVRIASAESGLGWIPFVMEAIEYQLDEMVTDSDEVALQQRRPIEYFRDHIYVTFWFERIGPSKLLHDVGVNNVMIETDVPHPTCIYPAAKERIASVVAELDPHSRRRVLQDNAAELYGISIPQHTPTMSPV